MKNVTVAVGFAVITVSQLVVGLYELVHVAREKRKGKLWA